MAPIPTTAPCVAGRPNPPMRPVPAGFFDEVAASLETESASEIAEAVIDVCTRRGILHPELDDEPDAELRADELREVFSLLAVVTDAVSDGTIQPSRVRIVDEMDPGMAAAWDAFTAAAADPQADEAVATMLAEGKPEQLA